MAILGSRNGQLRALLAMLAFASSVHAKDHPDSAAEALFREGRDAMKSGSFALACARFEESQRMEPALGTLLNLALCEEARGRLSFAQSLFDQLLENLPAGDTRRSLVEAHLPELARRIPTLTLVPYGCEAAACELFLDGERIRSERARTPIPVDPGDHHVVLVAVGHPDHHTTVTLAEGEAAVQAVGPAEVIEPRAEVSPPSEHPASSPAATHTAATGRDRTLAYVVGGIGAASLVASLVTGLMAISAWETVQRDCTATTCSSEEALAANSRGRALSIAATTTFTVGVVGVGAGTVLFFTGGTAAPARGQLGMPSLAIGLSHRF